MFDYVLTQQTLKYSYFVKRFILKTFSKTSVVKCVPCPKGGEW